jgi:hypothetical protein
MEAFSVMISPTPGSAIIGAKSNAQCLSPLGAEEARLPPQAPAPGEQQGFAPGTVMLSRRHGMCALSSASRVALREA